MNRDAHPAPPGEASSRLQARVDDLSPAKRALLEKRLHDRGRETPGIIRRRPDDVPFAPLTYGQRALWYLGQLNPDSAAYIVFRAWRIRGNLDRNALEWSIAAIAGRHEALRSSIQVVDKEVVQVVADPCDNYLEYLDLREESVENRMEHCRDLAYRLWSSPMRLTDRNLFHAHLIRVDDREHVLSIKLHHAFCDGWSIGLFVRELGHLYKSRVTGTDPALPDLPIQYGDYAWCQRTRADRLIESDVDYWMKQLAGAPELLELPAAKKRPSVQRHRGARHFIRLPPAMVDRLDDFARQRAVTPFMVLLATYTLVLSRFSGQDDICVGVPFASRNRPGLENLIGLMVNTVALRNRIHLKDTFDVFLETIKETTIQGFEHAAAPLDLLVEKLGLTATLGHNPLFQTMFVLQTGVQRSLDLHGLEVEDANIGAAGSFSLGNRTSKFDLSLTLVPVAEGLDGVLEYDIDLFEHDMIERIGDAFLAVLGAALNDSTTPVHRLPVMGAEEQRRIVHDWNDTHRTRSDESVVSRFEFIAEQRADTGALRCGDREVSYGLLRDDANRVAGCLLEAGIRSGDRVGVCIEPSMQLTASLLGVLKCGALFVPLEPDLPTARLRALIEDARISRVLVDDTTAGPFDSLPVECVDANASPAGNGALPDIGLRGADPAYVLFTSGSTGSPKGVVGTHGGLLNRIDWIREEYPYQKDEWCCHRTNLGFVDAIAEIFAPLLCGVPAVVFTRNERSTPATLTDALARHGITRLTLAPVLLRALLHQQEGIRRLKSLRYCICSGEVLPVSLWERFHEQLPDATLLNLYGSTEVAADATWFDCRNAVPGRPIPIGKPIHNTRVYVVDEFMRPQPIGVAGSLLVSGIGLAKGYWNNPGLTAERFLQDPFNEGETSYVTGDLARFLPDGNLEYLGRADNQIKLHGIRIDPVEIEAVLARHPAVQSAVVALFDHPERGQRLAAWIVYAVSERPGVTALRAYLGEHLPRHWIPSLYVELQQLPLLPSGKVDRQALPPPDDSRPDVAYGYEEPSTSTEKRLAAIWKRILGINQIGRTDDFFDLGGHSILVFELLQAIQEEFGAELPLSHVFLHPTVSRLAAQIEKGTAPRTRTPVVVPIRNRDESSPFFCIPAAAQSVYSIRRLASEFRDDQSFYAVQPLGFDGVAAPQDSVPQMVSTYVQALRERQPGGPYYLGGRCFGGVVAAEVARQLQEEGETIGLLVLLDTNVPNSRRLRYLLKQSDVSSRPGLLIRWPVELVLARVNRRRLAIETDQQLETLTEALAGRMRKVDEAHQKASRAYELTPITAPVVWIRAGVPLRGLRFGWAPFARGDFSCIDAVGDHASMFEPPHVASLSRTLSEVLAGRQGSRVDSVAS